MPVGNKLDIVSLCSPVAVHVLIVQPSVPPLRVLVGLECALWYNASMPYKDHGKQLACQRQYRDKHRFDLEPRQCAACGTTFQGRILSKGHTLCSSACRRAWCSLHHPWRGKVPPQIVKARAALAAKPVSWETRRKMSLKSKGHIVSLAQRQAISLALKGHKANPGSGIGVSGIRPDLSLYVRSR